MLADLHHNQADRIAALHSLEILDSEAEAPFNELVELIAEICGVPVALLSFVDEDRQWFKAKTGTTISETGLDMSVCSHTILDSGLTVIADTDLDNRTSDMPKDEYNLDMRFYAGMPIETVDGMPVGALCVLDDKPRNLTDFQKNALRILGNQASSQIKLRKLLLDEAAKAATQMQKVEKVEEEKEELVQDLNDQEILNQEIDHRVKNSLQLVTSILRLQAGASDHEEVKEALKMAQERVVAIASVHSELDKSTEQDEVNLVSYLTNLTSDLSAATPNNITIKNSVEPMAIDSKLATSLAMIFNEFVANSVKYAFPNNSHGVVKLTIKSDGKKAVAILTDDGIGYSGDSGSKNPKGLGIRIMEAAARQLNTRLKFGDGENGTMVTFEIPISENAVS